MISQNIMCKPKTHFQQFSIFAKNFGRVMKNILVALFFFLTITACKSSGKEIIPTDIEPYKNAVVTNDDEAIGLGVRFREECQNNTIGKLFPSITVTDTDGMKHDLSKMLVRESVIIAGSNYEGYGREEFVSSFPETIRSLEEVPGEFDVYCLVIDSGNPDDNTRLVTELSPNYRNIYIISGEEAAKINVFSNPTKLYLNKERAVVHYAMGYVIEDQYRQQEAEEGIKQMFKKRL